jgi:hypothetical protein
MNILLIILVMDIHRILGGKVELFVNTSQSLLMTHQSFLILVWGRIERLS